MDTMKKLLMGAAILVALTGGTSAETVTEETKKECLQFDKPLSKPLTGTITHHVGPDYGPDEPAHWSKQHITLITLDSRICAWGDGEETQWSVWVLHVLGPAECPLPHGTRVAIRGELFAANTVHHHSPVLMYAKEIKRMDGKPCGRRK
jgi:hypothetical protein